MSKKGNSTLILILIIILGIFVIMRGCDFPGVTFNLGGETKETTIIKETVVQEETEETAEEDLLVEEVPLGIPVLNNLFVPVDPNKDCVDYCGSLKENYDTGICDYKTIKNSEEVVCSNNGGFWEFAPSDTCEDRADICCCYDGVVLQ